MKTLHTTLTELGIWFRDIAPTEIDLIRLAESHNGWFTEDSVKTVFRVQGDALRSDSIETWLSKYDLRNPLIHKSGKRVGLVMAGNLPLVGWHDMLCALVAGHDVAIKSSSDDDILPKRVVKELEKIAPELQGRIQFIDGKLGDIDAVIATGSSNTTRYFESYFGHLPHIFRSQRTGVAFLDGGETEEELQNLGDDMFTHFGLGCRSTTKVFLPMDFDLDRCFAAWVRWGHLAKHNKYANNYDYHKAIWLLNQDELIENGFLLVKEDAGWVSPVGTLFIERYEKSEDVVTQLAGYQDGLQLVTSREGAKDFSKMLNLSAPVIKQVTLGEAQCPTLDDYADGVDSVKFFMSISK